MKRRNFLLGLLTTPVAAVAAPAVVAPAAAEEIVFGELLFPTVMLTPDDLPGRGQTSVYHHIDECAFYKRTNQATLLQKHYDAYVGDMDIASMYARPTMLLDLSS